MFYLARGTSSLYYYFGQMFSNLLLPGHLICGGCFLFLMLGGTQLYNTYMPTSFPLCNFNCNGFGLEVFYQFQITMQTYTGLQPEYVEDYLCW